jgi:AmiR/NasT family two-component response regulator
VSSAARSREEIPDLLTTAQEDNETDGHVEVIARLLELNSKLLEKTRQLETALTSRIVIEQAKGVLRARHGVDMTTAFDVLRRGARSNQMRVHDLAQRVVDEETTPREIQRYLP